MTAARRSLVWFGLLAVWLLLTDSLSPGQVLLGVIVATIAHWAALRLAPPKSRTTHPGTIAVLIWLVIKDVVQSNVAVLGLILTGRSPRSAFIDIPLELTDENGLAILACIVTATPGSAWIEHDASCNVVTIHVLDTPDPDGWAADFKRTYERRLLEILQ
jgi:multicomponent K+:H+ antiporter subunit E